MKINLLICLLIILFASCNDLKEENIENPIIVQIKDFPSKQYLKGESILTDNYRKNAGIAVIDTLLLIKMYDDTLHYDIYGANSLSHLGTLGTRGDGPDDWNVVFHVSQYEITDNGIMLWFSGNRKGFLLKVNLSKVIKSKSPKPIIEQNIKINSKLFPFNQLIYFNDTKIIGNSGYYELDRVRVKSYNPNTQEIIKSKLFPSIKNVKEFASPVMYNFYFGGLIKHPSKNLIAQPMRMMNRIDIFDENLVLVKSIVGGENWKDDYFDAKEIDVESNYTEGILDGYGSSSVTENFIFAVAINKEKSASTNLVKRSFIKVFDWEGNPKCLIDVSEDLFSISVDEDKGYLYATDIENEKILRYDIKQLIKKWKE